MTSGDIGGACVDEFTIHLIREEVEVILLHEVANLVHLATSIEVTRRIVGVTDEDGACALVDEFFKLLHFGK